MKYELLFDVSSAPRDNSVLYASALLAVVGVVLLGLAPRAGPFRARPGAWRVFMAAWTALVCLVVGGELWSRLGPGWTAEARVVEGVVQDFVPASPDGPKIESFVVAGIRFQYADWAERRGFHQTSASGGPIREGLQVRIRYVGPSEDPTIVRLEAREGSPCSGAGLQIDDARRSVLAPRIAVRLSVASVDVKRGMRWGAWEVVQVQPPASDAAYLFFPGDAAETAHVALWAGAAVRGEERLTEQWVTANVPGSPPGLAACFAWYVTH